MTMSRLKLGQVVRLSRSFCDRHHAMPWLADLIGTYQGPLVDDQPETVQVLWRGHERPQLVNRNHLEKAA